MQVTVIIEEKDFQNAARMSALRALFGAKDGTIDAVSSVSNVNTPTVLELEPIESRSEVSEVVVDQAINPTHDSTGMQWDGRIHSPNRTINADGTWRKKKGLDPATLAAVEAELKQSPATVEQQAVNDTAASLFGLPMREPQVQMTASQAEAAMFGSANKPQSPTTFPDLMKVVSAAVSAGKIDPVYIGQLTEKLGLASLADLVTNPAKIPAAYNMMQADGKV